MKTWGDELDHVLKIRCEGIVFPSREWDAMLKSAGLFACEYVFEYPLSPPAEDWRSLPLELKSKHLGYTIITLKWDGEVDLSRLNLPPGYNILPPER